MKTNKDFIPVYVKYNANEIEYNVLFNLLIFNEVYENEDGTCNLVNSDISISVDTYYTLDMIQLLLDENLGEDSYDVFNGGNGYKILIIHYIHFKFYKKK